MKKPFLVSISLSFLLLASCSLLDDKLEVFQVEQSIDLLLEAHFQSDGSEDMDMDESLFEITKAFEDKILNPLNFEYYAKLFTEYQEVHLSKILSQLDLKASVSLMELQSMEENLKIGDFEFCACLMIPNFEVADFTLNPIIAPGVEIDYKGDDLTGDIIAGWYYDEKGEKQIIYLDEKLGTSIKRPVLIITNDDQDEARIAENTMQPSLTKSTNTALHTTPIVDRVMIKYRYESPGRSDVNLGFVVQNQGPFNKKLKDIHKSDLGALININVSLDSYCHADDIRKIYMVSYEKDWNRSAKTIVFQDNYRAPALCKMKNLDEWYVKTYASYNEDGYLEELYDAVPGSQNKQISTDKGALYFEWPSIYP